MWKHFFYKLAILGALSILAPMLIAANEFKLNPTLVLKYPTHQPILADYASFMNSLHVEKSLHVKLEKVNNYINAIVPRYDDINSNSDYWATRLEFLLRGGGDCEDYAIAKYQSLLDLGFGENEMGLCVAKDKYSGTMHMVLGVQDGQSLQILDNLSFRILPYEKRIDLEFHGCLSVNKSVKIHGGKSWGKSPPKALEDKFKELLDRVKSENLWQN